MKKRFTKLAILLIIIMMIGSACQSISGVDLNKVIQKNAELQTFEGEASFSIHFDLRESLAADSYYADELKMLELFQDATLHIHNMKFEDYFTFSLDGSLELGKGEIHFAIFTEGTDLYIDIEGTNSPLMIEDFYGIEKLLSLLNDNPDIDSTITQQQIVDLQSEYGLFLISNIPNPQNIKLTHFANAEVGGQNLSLKKLEMSIDANEAIQLAKQTLKNILKDEEGLNQLLGKVYDTFAPVLLEYLKSQKEENVYEFVSEPMDAAIYILENKDQAVEFAKSLMKIGLIYLNAMVETMPSTDEKLIEDDSYFKTTLYFNSNLYIQRSDVEFHINPANDENELIDSITVIANEQIWNLNDASIEIDKFKNYEKAVTPFDLALTGSLENYVATDSVIYDILKNDFKIAKKTVYLVIVDSPEEMYSPNNAYRSEETIMIPLRSTAESLGIALTWDKENEAVKLEFNEQEAYIKNGEISLVVGGETISSDLKAETYQATTYVPAQFFIDFLNADVAQYGFGLEITIY